MNIFRPKNQFDRHGIVLLAILAATTFISGMNGMGIGPFLGDIGSDPGASVGGVLLAHGGYSLLGAGLPLFVICGYPANLSICPSTAESITCGNKRTLPMILETCFAYLDIEGAWLGQ